MIIEEQEKADALLNTINKTLNSLDAKVNKLKRQLLFYKLYSMVVTITLIFNYLTDAFQDIKIKKYSYI